MSKGGGDSTTTTRTEIDPQIKAAYLNNVDYARNIANLMGTRQFAGFDPLYQAGEAAALGAGGGVGAQNLGTASDLTRAAAAYSPMQVGADQAAIQGYFNPYQQQVTNLTQQQLEQQRQQAMNTTAQQAQAAKAFGGSRQGVAEALSNAAWGQTAAKTLADLNYQGWNQAQGLAQQAALANQSAGLQGAQFRLGAAQQLGQQGQQQYQNALLNAQNAMQFGTARQQLAQQQMDAARNLGLERLGIMQSALGLNMPNMGGTVTSTSPLYQNTGAGILGGAMAGWKMSGGSPWGALGGGLLGLL